MSDEAELYSSPSFQFYPSDFLGDTQDLSAPEIGCYIRLLCHAWKEGGIPSDMTQIARIGRLTKDELLEAWVVLSRFWKPSADPSRLVNGRMERIREEAEAHSKAQSERGKLGAEKRWHGDGMAEASRKHSGGIAKASRKNSDPMPQAMLTDGSPVSDLQSPNSDSLRSSALAFGDWPQENDGLRRLAKFFMAAFGNIKTADSAKKHYPAYLEALSIFRSRSVPLVVAWQACTDCLEANGKPLFGAQIKKAVSFLPARPPLRAVAGGVSHIRTVTQADLDAMP